MRSLADVDRDLEALGVPATRLAETRARAVLARPASLAETDAELESLAAGAPARARAAAPNPAPVSPAPAVPQRDVARPAEEQPAPEDRGSGLIEVSDEVLRSTDLPAVLALDPEVVDPDAPNAEIAGALSALALDLDSGEMPIEMEAEPIVRADVSGTHSSRPPFADVGLDDPNADLSALLGEADPLRDSAPPGSGFDDLEEEHTAMFTAADAARFSRPPAADPTMGDRTMGDEAMGDEAMGDGAMAEDVELDMEEVILDDEELMEPVAAAPARTQPPPPPRTMPPEPPKGARPSEAPRGFLGKLLQRKP